MTKQEFLKLAEARFEALEGLNSLNNFYDYEKEFDRIWIELGQQVLDANLGESPSDRRKKKQSRPDTEA